MSILFEIPPKNIKETYHNIKRILCGNDEIIFKAAEEITKTHKNKFILPESPTEYEQKHAEIERRFDFSNILKGHDFAIALMQEIWVQVLSYGGLRGISTDDLLNSILFRINDNGSVIRLTKDFHWEYEKLIHVDSNYDEKVFLKVHNKDWGEIVPAYIVQYIISSIYAFEQKMHAVSVALLSIAIEATLRDVLSTKGYTFRHGASSVDIYDFGKAYIGVNGTSYTIDFHHTMPKLVSDFPTSTSGANNIEVKIKRVINSSKNRTELVIVPPDYLIDHLSPRQIIQQAQKRVNGLGEALDIARNIECFLSASIIPLDLDDVIQKTRNNLIHLSGDDLNTNLDRLDMTLKEFLDDRMMVFDLVARLPKFVSDQYLGLRNNGHLAV